MNVYGGAVDALTAALLEFAVTNTYCQHLGAVTEITTMRQMSNLTNHFERCWALPDAIKPPRIKLTQSEELCAQLLPCMEVKNLIWSWGKGLV